MTKIKICGLTRKEDIACINALLPDYCGFVIDYPKSHRSLSPVQVRALVDGLDRAHVKAAGVFVNAPVGQVAELLNDGTLDMAQLHGDEDESYIAALRNLTDKPLLKAFTVNSLTALEKALKSSADHILLDAGKGSGKTFDWKILDNADASESSSVISELSEKEWFLAGGLNETNIASAIRKYRPYAVDLSSAVETERLKDPVKIERIIDIVRGIMQ